jgi:hypothetical protein
MHRRSYVFSALLHIAVVLLAMFGLPFLMRPPIPDNQPVVVDIVALGSKSNPPPIRERRTEERHVKAAHPKPRPPEPKPAPKPEPKPAPKPQPQPAPKPPPPPPPRPAPAPIPVPKPAPKPLPKKPTPKHEVRHKPRLKQDQELKSLLKSVENIKPAPKTKTKVKPKPQRDALSELLETAKKVQSEDNSAQQQERHVRGSPNANPMEPLSMTVIDMIKAQIYKCWNVPAGAKNAAELVVPVHVRLAEDGSVLSAEAVDTARMNTDPFYRAAAESAVRAVRICSPLQNLPANKYQVWKDMTLVFNPKDMVGQ